MKTTYCDFKKDECYFMEKLNNLQASLERSHNSDYAAALYQRLIKKKFTPEQCMSIVKTVKSLNASHFA